MDKEERRQYVNDLEDDLDDVRETVDESLGMLLNLLQYMQEGQNYTPEACKRLYSEYKETRKSLLRKIDEISEDKFRNLR